MCHSLQTKSEAAEELEKFRKATTEEEGGAGPPFLTCTSPPVFTPPPPPMIAPPPPPVLPQAKPNTVAHPSANAPVNPALAREAMLEAIRSGSAADRLKKVLIQKNTASIHTTEWKLLQNSQTSFICSVLAILDFQFYSCFVKIQRWGYRVTLKYINWKTGFHRNEMIA